MNKHNNPILDLESKLLQLQSLTLSIYGEGFSSFKSLPAEHQDTILWLIHDLASNCNILFQALEIPPTAVHSQGGGV